MTCVGASWWSGSSAAGKEVRLRQLTGGTKRFRVLLIGVGRPGGKPKGAR